MELVIKYWGTAKRFDPFETTPQYFVRFEDGLRIKITKEQFERLDNQTSPEAIEALGQELR